MKAAPDALLGRARLGIIGMVDARSTAGFIVGLAGLCAACAATPGGSDGPSGWTEPSAVDLGGPDEVYRQSSPTAYLSSSADFDGDNREDVARILVNRRSGKYGAFIFPGGTGTPAKVYEGPLGELNRAGLSALPPGRYQTACSRGLGPDEDCDPASVQMRASGLQHFTFESGSVTFYWDGSNYVSVYLTD
jgi:hypothetical protein